MEVLCNVVRKSIVLAFVTWSNINQAVQSKKKSRGFKFWI